MILEWNNDIVVTECAICQTVDSYDVSSTTVTFNTEFNTWNNFPITCDNCGSTEHFNMALDMNPIVNPQTTEQEQKVAVQIMISKIRQDYQE